MTRPDPAPLETAFAAHEKLLWGLCYRMTGCAADADDLVQETFARALERPPARPDLPWRPWLVRVAMNLCRDALRRRRRRDYPGPWLPSPVPLPDEPESLAGGGAEPMARARIASARYDLLESASYAFLLALEVITPAQRAVLLLRDVYDYSVRETAEALGMSEANVKTTLHRARRAMAAYDGDRHRTSPELPARIRAVLERFLTCMMQHDIAGLEALLAEDVRLLSDGGGEFVAARVPVIGRARVARFYAKLATRQGAPAHLAFRLLNALPAVVCDLGAAQSATAAPVARRLVLRCELDAGGRIREIHSIMATRKLTAVRFW